MTPGDDQGQALTFENAVAVRLEVNGQARQTSVGAGETLLDWLRETVSLTGAKKGCNEGACGSCTVLLDGQRVNGCLVLMAQCDGAAVTTVEGLSGPQGELHPVQQTFLDRDGFQCGYCTSGQIVSAVACIAEHHATSEAQVQEWMSGNICRCASYPQIVAAVLDAAMLDAAGASGSGRPHEQASPSSEVVDS